MRDDGRQYTTPPQASGGVSHVAVYPATGNPYRLGA